MTASETSEELNDFAVIIQECLTVKVLTLELISSQVHISPTIFAISD